MNEPNIKYMNIFVDSQAAIQAVGNPYIKSKAVARAIDSLNKLAAVTKRVTIVWIPAHKGHVGNERADVLAKRGSKEESRDRLLKVGIPAATIQMRLQEQIYKEWQEEWTGSSMAHHSKSFYGGPSKTKARFVYKLARLELGRFVRIITGHNNLNFFQHKIGLHNSSKCRFCGQGDETITHFLVSCPRFFSHLSLIHI